MGSSGEALSDERLARIKQSIDDAGYTAAESDDPYAYEYANDVPLLVAEIERQRAALAAAAAREAALLAIVRAVGEEDHEYPDMTPGQTRYLCPFCPGNDAATRMAFVHARWCPVTQARALLASADEQGEA